MFGPGFVDLQCNGFEGVDFNRRETEPIVIAGAIKSMWEHGCTEVLPMLNDAVHRLDVVPSIPRVNHILEIVRPVFNGMLKD